jgi:hypothetical protein
MALLRGSTEGMQDADDCDISRDDADSDGYDYGQAQNDGHQERDHDQPPLAFFKIGFKSASKSCLHKMRFTETFRNQMPPALPSYTRLLQSIRDNARR